MTRDPNWWARLDGAFQGALELPPAERPAYLDQACWADPDLRAEVEEMLAAEGAPGALDLEQLVHREDSLTPEPDPFIGMRLGAWRVLHALGHGGVVGRLYSNLSLHDTAIEIFEQALTLERKERPQGSLTQAETMHWLAELHVRKNDYVAAERFFRDALMLRQALGAPAGDVAATLESLGRALSFSGRHGEAEVPLHQAVEIRRQQPSSPAALMSSLNELALTLHRKGEMEVAERLFREAVDVGRRAPGSSPEKVTSMLNLARLVHRFDRDPQRSEPMYREALALARAIYPNDHEDIATCLSELSRAVRDMKRLPEAEALSREARTMFIHLFGTRHRETMISSQALASIRRAQGDLGESETLSREALATALGLFKAGHPMTLGAQRSLASLLEEQKRFKESRELREAELAAATKSLGAEDVYVALALTGLGQHGLASGNLLLAESSFKRALAVRERLHGSSDWRTAEARGMVGAVRLRAGRLAEAEPDLLAAYDVLQAQRGPSSAEAGTVRVRLVELYERWKRNAQAQRYRGVAH